MDTNDARYWHAFQALMNAIPGPHEPTKDFVAVCREEALEALWRVMSNGLKSAAGARPAGDVPGVTWRPEDSHVAGTVRCLCGAEGAISTTHVWQLRCLACRRVYDLRPTLTIVPVDPSAPPTGLTLPAPFADERPTWDGALVPGQDGRQAALADALLEAYEVYLDSLTPSDRAVVFERHAESLRSLAARAPAALPRARVPETVFVSGHLDLTEAEFEAHYVPQLVAARVAGARFVVGDAPGCDLMTQRWLHDLPARVAVYHMLDRPRHNVGFLVVGGFPTDEARDAAMTAASSRDIAWVRPGRERSGTAKNLQRRRAMQVSKRFGTDLQL